MYEYGMPYTIKSEYERRSRKTGTSIIHIGDIRAKSMRHDINFREICIFSGKQAMI